MPVDFPSGLNAIFPMSTYDSAKAKALLCGSWLCRRVEVGSLLHGLTACRGRWCNLAGFGADADPGGIKTNVNAISRTVSISRAAAGDPCSSNGWGNPDTVKRPTRWRTWRIPTISRTIKWALSSHRIRERKVDVLLQGPPPRKLDEDSASTAPIEEAWKSPMADKPISPLFSFKRLGRKAGRRLTSSRA